MLFVLSLWAAVGVGVGVGCWCGVLVWAVGVGCWRGISKFWRGDSHPCEVLQFDQCSDGESMGSKEGIHSLL